MREQYDKNNFDHDQFYWNQETLDKANARKLVLDMLDSKEISKEQKNKFFSRIDKYITKTEWNIFKVLIWKSPKDKDWNEREFYINL